MNTLEDKIVRNIDGAGIYFTEHIDDRTLMGIRSRLEKTVIGVFNCDDKKLAIEVKGIAADEQELLNDLKPFVIARPHASHDIIIDSEKFLRCIFEKDSRLSKKYIMLIDANILNRTLQGNDGDLINLRVL